MIYMQARFYAPMYGRFLSPDPARDQHFEQTQSWNIYSYVQNNPVSMTDPTGMVWTEAVINALKKGYEYLFKPEQSETSASKSGCTNAPIGESSQTNAAGTTSWEPGKPLPANPGGLGPDWQKDMGHRNPNGEQWGNDKTGEKLEFEPGREGEKGVDHWHHTPAGEKKGKDHLKPGETVEPKKQAREASWPWEKGWNFNRTPLGMAINWVNSLPLSRLGNPGANPGVPPLIAPPPPIFIPVF